MSGATSACDLLVGQVVSVEHPDTVGQIRLLRLLVAVEFVQELLHVVEAHALLSVVTSLVVVGCLAPSIAEPARRRPKAWTSVANDRLVHVTRRG